jgi:hypothetical protein
MYNKISIDTKDFVNLYILFVFLEYILKLVDFAMYNVEKNLQ